MSTPTKTHDGIKIRWAFQTSDWRDYQERSKEVIRHAWRRSTEPGLTWITLCEAKGVLGEPEFISRSNVPKCEACAARAWPPQPQPLPEIPPTVITLAPGICQLYQVDTPLNNGEIEHAHVIRWRERSIDDWLKDQRHKDTQAAEYPAAQYKCWNCGLAAPSNASGTCRHMRAVTAAIADETAALVSR